MGHLGIMCYAFLFYIPRILVPKSMMIITISVTCCCQDFSFKRKYIPYLNGLTYMF